MGSSSLARSRLVLDRLQERQDLPDHVCIQDTFPRRHAFGGSALAHGRVEHLRHILAVPPLQAAEIRAGFRIHGIGRVAVCAVLIEQTAPHWDEAGVTSKGIGLERC